MRKTWMCAAIALLGVGCGDIGDGSLGADDPAFELERGDDDEMGESSITPTPAQCQTGQALGCAGDDRVVCDEDGNDRLEPCEHGCNGAAGQCNECEPAGMVCGDSEVVVCGDDGQVEEVEACPLGCGAADRCAEIVPSNGLGAFLADADDAPDIDVSSAGVTIDTDAGQIRRFNGPLIAVPSVLMSPSSAGAIPVRVFIVGSLVLGDANVIGGPAAAFVSSGDVEVTGTVQLRAGPGSCSGNAGQPADPAVDVPVRSGGGGGGSYASFGGSGASTPGGSAGGAVGLGEGNQAIVPLRGGCRGGNSGAGAAGGSGGGSMQIVSRSRITVTGRITAGGRGGSSSGLNFPGAGGGSGGALLLEAPEVTLEPSSALTVNGGGGGCPLTALPGRPGSLNTSRADGACPAAGPGGAGVFPAGQNALSGSSAGGGGSAGRIRLNSITAPLRAGLTSGVLTVGDLPLN